MTKDEFDKLPFRTSCHMSWEDEHTTTYVNEEYGISVCVHVPYVDGAPKGRTYSHYAFAGKIYKTRKSFLKAIEPLKIKSTTHRLKTCGLGKAQVD